jgi:hypothetical protein
MGGGHRNALKRLNSDKRIEGNPSLCLGKIWLNAAPAWLNLAQFGLGLGKPANLRLHTGAATLKQKAKR